MNKIPKSRTKNSLPQPNIKITKKEAVDVNINIKNGNKLSQRKLRYNDPSHRNFGDDISNQIKNTISSNNNINNNINHSRKSLSNVNEKVNHFYL